MVGVGALGRHHLKWLAKLPGSDLVGLFDIDTERANKYAEEYGVRAFDSLEELAGEVEAVSVVVPTSAHREVAGLLIERGLPCLIEKPVTATIDEARELQQLAAKHNTIVTVGHIERFNPAVRALTDGDIRPSFIEAHRLASFDPRGTDVAVVLDLMIHDIDLVLSFVKAEIVDIQASAVAVVSDQADIANARLTFRNGAVANLTASRISLRAMRKMRLFQKSGYYSLDLAEKQADLYSMAEPGSNQDGMRIPLGKSGREIIYRKRPDNGEDMLSLELQSFLAAAAGESPVIVTLDEATEALRVALEIKRIGAESISRMMESESN